MKTLYYFSLVILISTLSYSCSKDDSPEPDSPFQGEWNGTFSGDDSGTWTANINSDGNSTIVVESVDWGAFSAEGKVDSDGSAKFTYGSVSSGATFSGLFTQSSASGTWINKGEIELTGTWNGSRDNNDND